MKKQEYFLFWRMASLILMFFCISTLGISPAFAKERFLPCGNCGKLVSTTKKVCPYCKAEFEEFDCPNCGKTIPTSAKICPYCKYPLTSSSSSQEKKKPTSPQEDSSGPMAPDFSRPKSLSKANAFTQWQKKIFYDAYFRISGRTDFGHGSKTLGWWPLYGRLLNETNWFQLGLGVELLEPKTSTSPRARVYGRIEGDSFRTADSENGILSRYAFTQFYLESENVPAPHYVIQAGTLWYNMGYIGIYDLYAAQTFWETVGLRIGKRFPKMEWFVGLGDSGYEVLKERRKNYPKAGYNSIPTLGGLFKVNFHGLWVGSSLMLRYELGKKGNRNSLQKTPGIDYREVLRGDVLENYLTLHPSDPQGDFFPTPTPVNDFSWRWTYWMGFGNLWLGPVKLRWNDLSIAIENKPADLARSFTFNGVTKEVYLGDLTDERYEITLANESYFEVLPGKLDMILGAWVGYAWDRDNRYRPDDANRFIFSLVGRPQYYLNDYFHLLAEASFAVEKSTIGNRYREHFNSIQSNTGGIPDPKGLEWGDREIKYTLQFKGGIVWNLGGKGIYSRPSIRLLFGVQYSNVHAAFGNSYVESLNRQNFWNINKDAHWHYMISIEVEHWFGGS